MAGHSKWHSIRHKKAANDAKRGKILTKHAKIIAVVAQSDPNPDTNASLRVVISNAKSDGVPRDNIERILKKIEGGDNNASKYQEVVYEGFGPHGVAFIVTALTDNVNRTFPEVRTAFMKNNGNLGTSGTVMFQFNHIGVIQLGTNGRSEEEVMELVMDVDAQDFSYHEEITEITTAFTDLARVRDALIDKNIELKTVQPEYRAKDPQIITNKDELETLESFIEKIEEVDDVSDVYTGFVPDENLLTTII